MNDSFDRLRQRRRAKCRAHDYVHAAKAAKMEARRGRQVRRLVDEKIELGAGLLIDAVLLDVLRDTDDGEPGKLAGATHTQPLADWVLSSPKRLHERFVHDRDEAGPADVAALEGAALNNGDPHRLEVVG